MAAVGTQQTSSAGQYLNPHHPSATSIPSRTASAPLPSPTAQRPQFMSAFTTSSMASTASTTSSTSTAAFAAAASASSVQNAPPQYQYHATDQGTVGNHQQSSMTGGGQQNYTYAPERGNAGSTAQETRSYIDNFALVAEAAKRAQMAVLMRDMEGVELS